MHNTQVNGGFRRTGCHFTYSF